MAKQLRQNDIKTAIKSVTAALRLESIPNPTAEQLQQIHEAKVNAADIIDNSNVMTMAEYGNDDIVARVEAEQQAELEAAGIGQIIDGEVIPPAALPEPENEAPPLEN